MTDTATTPTTALDEAEVEAFSGRLFVAGLAAFELLTVELGRRLGLYDRLAESGPITFEELAAAAGVAGRYAREWLEQQAVAGIVDADDADEAAQRRYSLSAEHAHVLLDEDSPAHTAPIAGMVPIGGRILPSLVDAFRTGGGVPYADYEVHDVQAALNRPTMKNELVHEWLPAVPGFGAGLAAGDALTVADIGCGEGFSSIAIASAYPNVRVDGFDLDEASIARARELAADAGVADRVRFELGDAARTETLSEPGRYDLVLAFEMLHDVPDPVGVLGTMRALRADGGAVLVVDERVADTFTAPGDEIERLFYASSVLHCLPASMVTEGSAATGTVMRVDTVRRYAAAAGFADVRVLPVEHMEFRLYLLEG
jgi:2-polyprenyl-3-methyl-5-hydroxy-6-metoxy-1,4-benzoquinol methylase